MKDKLELSEFLAGYLAEAEDLVASASKSLLAIEGAARSGAGQARPVREAFRALHTIKGLSAMVGIEPIVAIAHRMESSLRQADREGLRLSPRAIDRLLEGLRAIEQRVRSVAEGKPPAEPSGKLLEALEELAPGTPALANASAEPQFLLEPALLAKLAAADKEQILQALAAGRQAVRADFAPSEERQGRGLTITSVRERLKASGEIVKVLPLSVKPAPGAPGGLAFAILFVASAQLELPKLAAELELTLHPLASAPLPAPPEDDEVEGGGLDPDFALAPSQHRLVRVQVSRLDDAMERLSALIVTRFRLAHALAGLAERGADVRELKEIVTENARQLRDLRTSVLQVRMVPAAEVLERVPLLVRGLKQHTGKQVRLQIDAGAAEVDKAVAERIFPAIVHLVRNAVDHALELPAERAALGKPEEGLLRIFCSERGGNQLELAVQDDGRGVDRRRVAERSGRPLPETDAQLLELLCLPGLSTRDEATTTSGRGMGMDIVKRIAVDELGGELLLETRPGHGSTFTLRVPLTITIVDAFTFESAGQRFVVPVALVEEVLEVDPRKVVRGPSQAQGARQQAGMLQRRGQPLPLLRLDALFGLRSDAEPTKAIVVRRAGQLVAFAVHRMVGQQEVVVRPLEDPLVKVVGVSGATDLGDGRPTLVLDLAAIAGEALQARQPRPREVA